MSANHVTVDVRRRLSHVRWLAGGTGCGKSTVARILASRHRVAIYDGDEAEQTYVKRCTAEQQPRMMAWVGMSLDERWLARSPTEIFESMPSLHGETFGFVVADLLALPSDRVVVVDDFRTLPSDVAPLLSWPGQAVFLIPTPAFRRAALSQRYSNPGRARTAYGLDPDIGLENRLARDTLWDAEVRRQALTTGLPVMTTDGARSAASLADAIAQSFRLQGE